MDTSMGRQLAELPGLTVNQLQAKYAVVFGESTHGRNKEWLVKRIAWRLQANAAGGLSARARKRAAELADDANLRLRPPPAMEPGPVAVLPIPTDPRLPPPGSVLVRRYKGGEVRVTVLADGFAFAGEVYRSLSAVAKVITGSHCNGFLFFKLTGGVT